MNNTPKTFHQQTLLGYFDIQAFSRFIEEYNPDEAIKLVEVVMSEFKQCSASLGNFRIEAFSISDSIILVLDTSNRGLDCVSIEWFIASCTRLMTTALQNNLPLRGSIGAGYFYKNGDVIVSSALSDAAKYEKEIDWLGTILTIKAVDIIRRCINYDINLHLNGQFNGMIS